MNQHLKVYKASAGSGKTHTITREFLRIILDHPHSDTYFRHIQAVTFTNLATGELRDRFIRELYTLSETPEQSPFWGEGFSDIPCVQAQAKKVLKAILFDYQGLRVKTIDSFFQDVVRSLAIELRQRSKTRIELSVDQILDLAVQKLFSTPSNEAANAMRLFIENEEEKSLVSLRHAVKEFGTQLFNEKFQRVTCDHNTLKMEGLLLFQQELQEKKKSTEAQIEHLVRKIRNQIDERGITKKDFKGRSLSVWRIYEKSDLEYTIGDSRSIFTATAYLRYQHYLETHKGSSASLQELKAAEDQLYGEAQSVEARPLIDLTLQIASLLPTLITLRTASRNLYQLLLQSEVQRNMTEVLDELNLTLLDDTKLLVHRLISEDITPFIYERIGTTIRHHMIDEFQDTSQFQYDNFTPLLHETLDTGLDNLIVGDVKQSIYRFRNSDPQLLNERISIDFAKEYHEQNLSDNWRSSPAIITFNNHFYSALSQSNLSEILGRESANLYRTIFAPSEVQQQIPPPHRTKPGGILLHHFESEIGKGNSNKEEDTNDILAVKIQYIISQVIPDLLQRGYKMGDIAILSSQNNYLCACAEAIIKYNQTTTQPLTFISQEALFLRANPLYRIIIDLLWSLHTQHQHYTLLAESHIDLLARSRRLDAPIIDHEILYQFHLHTPLYDLIYHLIDLLRPLTIPSDQPYLTAFLDIIHDYSQTNYIDLEGFLSWHCRHESEMRLSATAQDAIQLLSIHKSKGLGFPVVILFEYNLRLLSGRDTIWCQTNSIAPISQISSCPPLLPINPSKEAHFSAFAPQISLEEDLDLLDRLNTIYVAMTRAKEEMHLVIDKGAKGRSFEALINSLSEKAIAPPLHSHTHKTVEIASYRVTRSEITFEENPLSIDRTHAHEEEESSYEMPLLYPPEIQSSHSPSIQIKPRTARTYRNQASVSNGIFIHNFLSRIDYIDDRAELDRLLLIEAKDGGIDLNYITCLSDQIYAALSDPDIAPYYRRNSGWEVLNERSITRAGQIFRPDRIIYNPTSQQAVIIDYKSGEHAPQSLAKHRQQLYSYRATLLQAGFVYVDCYLLYLSDKGHQVIHLH